MSHATVRGWKATIDVRQSFQMAVADEITVEQSAKRIAYIIRTSAVYEKHKEQLERIAGMFEEVFDVITYDAALDLLYTFGDVHNVWINTTLPLHS